MLPPRRANGAISATELLRNGDSYPEQYGGIEHDGLPVLGRAIGLRELLAAQEPSHGFRKGWLRCEKLSTATPRRLDKEKLQFANTGCSLIA